MIQYTLQIYLFVLKKLLIILILDTQLT